MIKIGGCNDGNEKEAIQYLNKSLSGSIFW